MSTFDARAIVVAANEKFMAAFKAGTTGMSDLYTQDAQLLPPNSNPIDGPAGIGTFWQGAYDMGIKQAELTTVEALPAGDFIIESGRYKLFGGDGQALDQGKYIVIWKPENGDWKLHRDIFNSSQPAS